MDTKNLMMRTLKKLLPHKETLLYPISCMIRDDDIYYAAFVGLTEKFLLIARMSGDYMINHARIPLDIASVKIKKLLGYTIDISFADHEPIRIQAPARMRKLDCQAENILGFCNTLRDRSPVKDGYNLRSLEGTKIRMQYFNTYLYFLAALLPAIFAIALVITWNDPRYSLAETVDSIMVGFITGIALLSPIILLSILNRFVFGSIVCTVHKDGIYLKNEWIPWSEIQSVRYIPEVPSRHKRKCCRLSVVRKKQSGKEFTTEIQHFPYYGLRKIRERRPRLVVTYDWGEARTVLIAVGVGFLIVLSKLIFNH